MATITPTGTPLPPTALPANSRVVTVYSAPVGGSGLESSVAVFWSEKGDKLYYAIRTSREPLELDWYVYNVAEQQAQQIAEPPPHDRTYVTLASDVNRSGVSPSGRYYLEKVFSDPFATPPDDPYVCQPKDILLVDTLTDERSLVKKGTCFGFTQVYWALAENRYYFGEGGDGLTSSSYAEVGKEAESLGPTDARISPDGEWLLYYSSIFFTMHLKNFSTGEHIELSGSLNLEKITWSLNSDFFYYLTSSHMSAYEIATGEYSLLVDMFEIKQMGLCQPGCYYAIAPDHAMIAIYTLRGISLVTLPN